MAERRPPDYTSTQPEPVDVAPDLPEAVLFSTSACHLCEQALELLEPWRRSGLALRIEDISESDELFERYGLTIPVLRRLDSGAELNWPFDQRAISEFFAAQAPTRP